MWWKHWRFMIKAMGEVEHVDLLHKAYEFELALVSNSRISADDFSSVQKEAKSIYMDLEGSMRPWLGRTKEDRKVREGADFKEQWEALTGFSTDDKDAVREWEEEIKSQTNAKQQERLDAETDEADRQSSFQSKIDAVRNRRLKQQGRK